MDYLNSFISGIYRFSGYINNNIWQPIYSLKIKKTLPDYFINIPSEILQEFENAIEVKNIELIIDIINNNTNLAQTLFNYYIINICDNLNISVIKTFISVGVDINQPIINPYYMDKIDNEFNQSQTTALIYFIKMQFQYSIRKLLLIKEIDINRSDYWNNTPLEWLLITHYFNFHKNNTMTTTEKKSLEIIKMLIMINAYYDINKLKILNSYNNFNQYFNDKKIFMIQYDNNENLNNSNNIINETTI